MNETLLDKAIQNKKVADAIRNQLIGDEVFLNYVGYHLQQSVEFALKHVLETNGVNYPKVHDITQLLLLLQENQINWSYNEYIDEHSEMLSMWESKTRYIKNYRLEKRKIDRASGEIEAFLGELQQLEQENETELDL